MWHGLAWYGMECGVWCDALVALVPQDKDSKTVKDPHGTPQAGRDDACGVRGWGGGNASDAVRGPRSAVSDYGAVLRGRPVPRRLMS